MHAGARLRGDLLQLGEVVLAEGLDAMPLSSAEELPAPPRHENLRGARYYAEEA